MLEFVSSCQGVFGSVSVIYNNFSEVLSLSADQHPPFPLIGEQAGNVG